MTPRQEEEELDLQSHQDEEVLDVQGHQENKSGWWFREFNRHEEEGDVPPLRSPGLLALLHPQLASWPSLRIIEYRQCTGVSYTAMSCTAVSCNEVSCTKVSCTKVSCNKLSYTEGSCNEVSCIAVLWMTVSCPKVSYTEVQYNKPPAAPADTMYHSCTCNGMGERCFPGGWGREVKGRQ